MKKDDDEMRQSQQLLRRSQEGPTTASVSTHCDGCGRPGHTKEECNLNVARGLRQRHS